MSAVNISTFPDRIAVWTDGAAYDARGTFLAGVSKIEVLPHLSCAIAVRGPGLALPLLAHALSLEFASFDALAADLGPAITRSMQQHAAVLRLCHEPGRYEVFLAGWSEQHGTPEVYHLSTDDGGDVARVEDTAWVAPQEPEAMERLAAEFPGLSDADLADPDHEQEVGLRLIELQREHRRQSYASDGPVCTIGGFVQRTVITPAGITTQIVRRWPDRIGERMGA